MIAEDLVVMGECYDHCGTCGEWGLVLVLNRDTLQCRPCWEDLMEEVG